MAYGNYTTTSPLDFVISPQEEPPQEATLYFLYIQLKNWKILSRPAKTEKEKFTKYLGFMVEISKHLTAGQFDILYSTIKKPCKHSLRLVFEQLMENKVTKKIVEKHFIVTEKNMVDNAKIIKNAIVQNNDPHYDLLILESDKVKISLKPNSVINVDGEMIIEHK